MGTNKKSHQRAPRSSSMTLAPIQMAQKAPQSLMQSRQRFVLQAAKRSAISVCRCSQRRTQGRHNSGSGVRRHGNFNQQRRYISGCGYLQDGRQPMHAVLAVHFKGHYCCSRPFAQYIREHNRTGWQIINFSYASGLYGNFKQANYGATKAGIAGFSRVRALELA